MTSGAVHRQLGLTDQEYHRICSTLGRTPTPTELAMFSVEWSEHCGYPRSRRYLALLPRTGKFAATVEGDAGGVEIEPGLFVVFKLESHNHPSQVEPKQGAATGVGGIIRDIFTLGARPIACLNSLRFGHLDQPLARHLFNGVVDGIQMYGNCVGVPTVAGEVYFNDCYKGNCLVNVMCVGTVRQEEMVKAVARGAGNAVMLVGSATGRDGIGGCSVLASHEFGKNDEKRPTVQIGDPFTEKCLIEATLEALRTGGIVGLKDMGAAGITCTTSEMSAAGSVGMDLDLLLVPRREEGMASWEVVMSESQERMLACVAAGREEEVAAIFRKWGLHAVVIGRVTDDGILRMREGDRTVAACPAQELASPPLYDLPMVEPAYIKQVQGYHLASLPEPADHGLVLLSLLASPNIASKEWVYQQYDHMVQVNTVVLPGAGCTVLRIKGTRKGIAVTTDCNHRYCYLDPYQGARLAVAEAARNVACAGAEPAGITDGLNFGNPDKPDRYWQFVQTVRGLADVCSALGLPVVSGNVSFYNETPEAAIYPTPVIGLVGVLPDVDHYAAAAFRQEGDAVILLGRNTDELGGSEYLAVMHGLEVGVPPALDLEAEQCLHRLLVEAIGQGLVSSAQDCSEGGLAVALAECAVLSGLGVTARVALAGRQDATLYGEGQGRAVLSVAPPAVDKLLALAQRYQVPAAVIGQVGGPRFTLQAGSAVIDLPVADLSQAYRGAIPCRMQ